VITVLIKSIEGLPDPLIDHELLSGLSTDRKEKIRQIKNVADRKRSLAAGLLLEKMVQDCGVHNPKYEKDENGKPYIKNAADLYFNLSHSGAYAVLGYSFRSKIGIDIQEKKKLRPGVERKILSDKEKEYVLSLDEEQKKEYLFASWSVKESYAKWDGRGIAIDFIKLEPDFHKGVLYDSILGKKVEFQQIEIATDYVCFICSDKREEVRIQYL